MNDFTEKLFCTPTDAETTKSVFKLNLSFKFIVGNYTLGPRIRRRIGGVCLFRCAAV